MAPESLAECGRIAGRMRRNRQSGRYVVEMRYDNPCSNVRLNCQKSAEAILGWQSGMPTEGPNVRSFWKFEVPDGYATKAENFK